MSGKVHQESDTGVKTESRVSQTCKDQGEGGLQKERGVDRPCGSWAPSVRGHWAHVQLLREAGADRAGPFGQDKDWNFIQGKSENQWRVMTYLSYA